MGSGKKKNAWPVWALVIAGVAVIILAVQHNAVEKEAVTFQDILPAEESASSLGDSKSAALTADPVQSPAIVANSGTGMDMSYAVQLYSFKEKGRADAVVSALKTQGLPAYMQMSDLGVKGIWYRVRVGSYATGEEAKQMLAQISKEHQGGIIVKNKK